MKIKLHPQSSAPRAELMALMNDPSGVRQMPPASLPFTECDRDEFLAAKKAMWEEHAYGPWAICVDGQFAGRGGLQAEQGEADFGLVIAPCFWGIGPALHDSVVRRAITEHNPASVTDLLPPSRTRVRSLLRLGYAADGEVEIDGLTFVHNRRYASSLPRELASGPVSRVLGDGHGP